MEIKQLTKEGFDAFPQLFAVPLSMTAKSVSNDGTTRKRQTSDVSLDDHSFIRGARYDSRSNRCILTVVSQGGSLERTFKLKLDAGYAEFKGLKKQRVIIQNVQTKRGKTVITLRPVGCAERTVRNRKATAVISAAFQDWLTQRLPARIDQFNLDAIKNKDNRNYLSPDRIMSWYDVETKRRVFASRVAFCLFSDIRASLTMQELSDAGILTEQPQIEIPASVLHKHDITIKYQFMGLFQKGGKGGHTMNLQTAKRVSRYIGESVSEEDLSTQLMDKSYLQVGPMFIWALGIAIKTTKEQL